MNEEIEDTKHNSWNMSIESLRTLAEVDRYMIEQRLSRNSEDWYWCLKIIFNRVCARLWTTEEEMKEYNEYLKELKDIGDLIYTLPDEDSVPDIVATEAFDKMDEFERKLHRKMYEKGVTYGFEEKLDVYNSP